MELSALGNQQVFNKTTKNRGENKNRSNESRKFIDYIADLIGTLQIFHFFVAQ